MKLYSYILLCFALFTTPSILRSTHIVGGEMTYKYLDNDNYEVTLMLFIDCDNGAQGAIAMDSIANFGVFDGSTGQMVAGFPAQVKRKGPFRLTKLNYSCISVEPNACVDQYIYTTVLNLPPSTGGYYVSFQRCCRNITITNLIDPDKTGANYWTYIPDARTLKNKKPNNSAVFKELPPNYLCTNTILKFDHAAVDPDGDSLVYELFLPNRIPMSAGPRPDNGAGGMMEEPPFENVLFAPGYDFEKPIDGNPPLSIDRDNGFLYLVPTVEGQFVVGIRVMEYRNGEYIAETRRDYQFNVSQCQVDMVAAFFAPKYACTYDVRFDNKSTGANRYSWDFGLAGTNADTSNKIFPIFVYPKGGKYRVRLTTYRSNCVDSFVQDVNVVEYSKPKLPKDTIVCESQPVTYISDLTADSYLWSNGARTKSTTVNKEGNYWLEVTIKTCKWRDTVFVKEDKDKIQGLGDTVYCTYDTFDRQLKSSDGFFQYRWNTGHKQARLWVDKKGDYVITARTINNCISSDTVFVEHYPPVVVELNDTTVCKYTNVLFDAQNEDAKIVWSNGATGRYLTLQTPGLYHVTVTRHKCYDKDTFVLGNFPDEFALGPDLRYCSSIDTWLTVHDKFTKVKWNNEVDGNTYHLMEPGKVVTEVTSTFGCRESDSLMVSLFPNPGLNLGRDTALCLSINPILDAGTDAIAYRWHDGRTERTYEALEAGLYWVEVKDKEGCKSRDSIMIEKSADLFPNFVYMPSAFTPDGNSINDWYPDNKYPEIGTLYNVKLYNRWGEKVAEYHTPKVNWDGNLHNKPAPEGVYAYLVTWARPQRPPRGTG